MERKNLPLALAFVLLAVLEISGELLDNKVLVQYSKPLLMPVLAVWLVRETPRIRRFLRSTVLAGLLFATLGDIFMMFSYGSYGELFFLLGLGAFLATHVCYSGGFFLERSLKKGYLQQAPLITLLPFALFLAGFLFWLWPDIPAGMRQPVTAYAVVISVMALSIVNLWKYVDRAVFTSLLAGALLFMLSDCLIAAYKFGHPFPGARVIIMGTYILGQWLIVRGVAARLKEHPQRPQ